MAPSASSIMTLLCSGPQDRSLLPLAVNRRVGGWIMDFFDCAVHGLNSSSTSFLNSPHPTLTSFYSPLCPVGGRAKAKYYYVQNKESVYRAER